ncbi:hypothetical protein CCHL11_00767 [Colletotrichum chlorophyti]|uniref:CENP-V/GFA domain-containing protein n=1 Tax=Colletotrichum chlorophyti TaxID=708187 RepID=A0A1Q8S5J3_9PEZI|nr:hypothetical protein CCHL11_00767 [Colletotrichum chlorophyti]
MGLKGSCMCQGIKYESSGAFIFDQPGWAAGWDLIRGTEQPLTRDVTEEPKTTALCHCLDCQKWTGSAFTPNAVVSRTAFKVTQGTPDYPVHDLTCEPKSYDVIGDSGKVNRHYFCPTCGSSLYTELDIWPDLTCIKAGGLDEGRAELDGKPAAEIYCKRRVSYLTGIPGVNQAEGLE